MMGPQVTELSSLFSFRRDRLVSDLACTQHGADTPIIVDLELQRLWLLGEGMGIRPPLLHHGDVWTPYPADGFINTPRLYT